MRVFVRLSRLFELALMCVCLEIVVLITVIRSGWALLPGVGCLFLMEVSWWFASSIVIQIIRVPRINNIMRLIVPTIAPPSGLHFPIAVPSVSADNPVNSPISPIPMPMPIAPKYPPISFPVPSIRQHGLLLLQVDCRFFIEGLRAGLRLGGRVVGNRSIFRMVSVLCAPPGRQRRLVTIIRWYLALFICLMFSGKNVRLRGHAFMFSSLLKCPTTLYNVHHYYPRTPHPHIPYIQINL